MKRRIVRRKPAMDSKLHLADSLNKKQSETIFRRFTLFFSLLTSLRFALFCAAPHSNTFMTLSHCSLTASAISFFPEVSR
jgi:hypothetical protein